MAETLHEMAVRMAKGEDCQPQCGKGCDKCPADKLRSANGVCLVRRIAKVDNCEEQIEGLRAWAAAHPEPVYPSWRDAWHSLFPNTKSNACPCPMCFGDECPLTRCDKCKQRPMSKEAAEKLGIKPIEERRYEHDGCEECKWMDKEEHEVPCVRCRGTNLSNPDLWTPKEYER